MEDIGIFFPIFIGILTIPCFYYDDRVAFIQCLFWEIFFLLMLASYILVLYAIHVYLYHWPKNNAKPTNQQIVKESTTEISSTRVHACGEEPASNTHENPPCEQSNMIPPIPATPQPVFNPIIGEEISHEGFVWGNPEPAGVGTPRRVSRKSPQLVRLGPHPAFRYKHICTSCRTKEQLLEFCDNRNRTGRPTKVNTVITNNVRYVIDPHHPDCYINEEPINVYTCNTESRNCRRCGLVCSVRHNRNTGHILYDTLVCDDNPELQRR